jgi:hypothetical protein
VNNVSSPLSFLKIGEEYIDLFPFLVSEHVIEFGNLMFQGFREELKAASNR